MKTSHHVTCIKSGLPLTYPGICQMCKRHCRLAGSRGKRYEQRGSRRGRSAKTLVQ